MTIPVESFRLIALLLLGLAGLILYRMARKDNPWRFVDMFLTTKDGKQVADRQAYVLVGAFYVSSVWGTVLALEGKLTDTFVLAYMTAWAGSHFGSRWLRVKEGSK